MIVNEIVDILNDKGFQKVEIFGGKEQAVLYEGKADCIPDNLLVAEIDNIGTIEGGILPLNIM